MAQAARKEHIQINQDVQDNDHQDITFHVDSSGKVIGVCDSAHGGDTLTLVPNSGPYTGDICARLDASGMCDCKDLVTNLDGRIHLQVGPTYYLNSHSPRTLYHLGVPDESELSASTTTAEARHSHQGGYRGHGRGDNTNGRGDNTGGGTTNGDIYVGS